MPFMYLVKQYKSMKVYMKYGKHMKVNICFKI